MITIEIEELSKRKEKYMSFYSTSILAWFFNLIMNMLFPYKAKKKEYCFVKIIYC